MKKTGQLGRVKRIWYLSPMRAAKVQASLRIRAVSPEPSLLAHTSSESRGTFRQKARSLAPLNGWACAVEICHDGMLEDTNSLDAAQLFTTQYMYMFSMYCNVTGQFRWYFLGQTCHSFIIISFLTNLGKNISKFVLYVERSRGDYWGLVIFFFIACHMSMNSEHCIFGWLLKRIWLLFLCPPTSKKMTGQIGFGLSVRSCGRLSVRASIRQEPCVLGFWNFMYGFFMENIWHTFFSCPSCLPFWSYAPLNKIRMKSDACHILCTVHTRILKFHIWIPHGKIVSELQPFEDLGFLKFVSKVSRKLFEIGDWNLVSW